MNKNITLFKTFFIASAFTFSGGLAMIPLLNEDLVKKNEYLTHEEFYHYVTLAQSIPGVTAVTTAAIRRSCK